MDKNFEQLLYQYTIDAYKIEHLYAESIYQKRKYINKSKQLIHKDSLTGIEDLQLTQNSEIPNKITTEDTDGDETVNQRLHQRYIFCRKPGYKYNRYPDIVVNSNS